MKATYSAFILVFIAMIFTSCSSNNSLASFNKRKYTPGYFADKRGGKDVVAPMVSKVATGAKVLPVEVNNNISVIPKIKLADSVRHLLLSHVHSLAKVEPMLSERANTVIYKVENLRTVKDSIGENKKAGHPKLMEGFSLVLAAVAIVAAFSFMIHSLPLYILFVLLSLIFVVLAYLIGVHAFPPPMDNKRIKWKVFFEALSFLLCACALYFIVMYGTVGLFFFSLLAGIGVGTFADTYYYYGGAIIVAVIILAGLCTAAYSLYGDE